MNSRQKFRQTVETTRLQPKLIRLDRAGALVYRITPSDKFEASLGRQCKARSAGNGQPIAKIATPRMATSWLAECVNMSAEVA
jgi:hypothetical protein